MSSWFEQRWEGFVGIPELNRLLDEILEETKARVRGKFDDPAAFVRMAAARLDDDLARMGVPREARPRYPALEIEGLLTQQEEAGKKKKRSPKKKGRKKP